jgi:hypothetical protein
MSLIQTSSSNKNINFKSTSSTLLVAVGTDSSNHFAYSTDGLTWYKCGGTFSVQNYGYVAWNGTMWIAVGNRTGGSSPIVYSRNGINWVSSTNNPVAQVNGVSWNGSYWLIGMNSSPIIQYSLDGITWTTAATTVFTIGANAFLWLSSYWIGFGSGTQSMIYSNDGLSWTALTNSFGSSATTYCGYWDSASGILVVGGIGNSLSMVYANVTSTTTPTSISFNSLLGNGSPFGTATGSCRAVSYNGRIWVAGGIFGTGYTGSPTSNTLAYSYDGKTWIGLGTSIFGTRCNTICWNGTRWIAGGVNSSVGRIATSFDGINWSVTSTNIVSSIVNGTTSSGSSTLFSSSVVSIASAVGPAITDGLKSNSLLSTVSFANNEPNTIDFTTVGNTIASAGEKGFKKIQIDEQYGKFIKSPIVVASASTGTNTLAYSVDGTSFTGRGATIFSSGCWSVAWNGSLWVAGGSGTNIIAYSTDGISWTGSTSANTVFSGGQCYGIAYGGSKWISIGNFGIGYSHDGINWKLANNTIFSSFGDVIVYNGNIWLAGGSGSNTLAYSYDGINWTGLGTTTFNSNCYTILWTGSRFVAGGDTTNTLAYSSDGLTWTGLGTTIFSSSCLGLAWNGSTLVATGSTATIANTIRYSLDNGLTWLTVASGVISTTVFTSYAQGLTWTGSYFVAVGASGVAYSTDGRTWVVATNIFSGNIGTSIFGGFYKWSGVATIPTIDYRTLGQSTAGIYSSSNSIDFGVNKINIMSIGANSVYIKPNAAAYIGAVNYGFTYLDAPFGSGTTTGTSSTLYIAGAPSGGTTGSNYAINVVSGDNAFAGTTFCTTNRPYSGSTINLYPKTDSSTGNITLSLSPTSGSWASGGSAVINLGDSNHSITSSFGGGMTISDSDGIRFGSSGSYFKSITRGSVAMGAQGSNFPQFTITHNLGTTPAFASAILHKNGLTANDSFSINVFSWSSTQIVFIVSRVDTNSGWGNSYTFYWMAMS